MILNSAFNLNFSSMMARKNELVILATRVNKIDCSSDLKQDGQKKNNAMDDRLCKLKQITVLPRRGITIEIVMRWLSVAYLDFRVIKCRKGATHSGEFRVHGRQNEIVIREFSHL